MVLLFNFFRKAVHRTEAHSTYRLRSFLLFKRDFHVYLLVVRVNEIHVLCAKPAKVEGKAARVE